MQVPEDRLLADPPLLRLESEASHAYLSILLHVQTADPPLESAEVRLVELTHITETSSAGSKQWMLHAMPQIAGESVACNALALVMPHCGCL